MEHTNTWGGRHAEQLRYLAAVIANKTSIQPGERIRILEIGAGGVPQDLAPLYASKPDQSKLRGIFRSSHRKNYTGPFVTYEPVEIVGDAFKDYEVDLTVVDPSQKVRDAVPRAFSGASRQPHSLEVIAQDIQAPLGPQLVGKEFDLVFAGVVLPYLENKQAAYENMKRLTAEGGIFSITQAEPFNNVKWILRYLARRLGEDYTQAIERQIANPESGYDTVVGLAGRRDFDIISGQFPVYQKKSA